MLARANNQQFPEFPGNAEERKRVAYQELVIQQTAAFRPENKGVPMDPGNIMAPKFWEFFQTARADGVQFGKRILVSDWL